MRYFIDKYVTLYYSGNQKWDTPNTGPGDFTMAALVQRCRDRYNIFTGIMFSNSQISDIQKLYFLDMRSTQPIRRKVQYVHMNMRFLRRAVEKWRRDILIHVLAGYLCNLGHSHVQ